MKSHGCIFDKQLFSRLSNEEKGHSGVVSGYPTFTSFPRVDGLSMDPRVLGCHKIAF